MTISNVAPIFGLIAICVASVFATAYPVRNVEPWGIAITDAAGHDARVHPDGRGVVLLDPLIGEYMIGARLPSSLESIGWWNRKMVAETPLGAIYPELLQQPDDDLFAHPSVERLLALHPKAIIPYTPIPFAEEIGLPVVRFKILREADWWLHNAPTAARLTEQPDRARQLAADCESDMAALIKALPPAQERHAPSLLTISPHGGGSLGSLHDHVDPWLLW